MPQEGQWKIVNDSYLSVEKVGSPEAYMAAPDYPTIHRQAAVASASPITALQPVARSLDKSSVESVGGDDPAHDDRVPPVSPATSVPTRLESAGTKDATQHLPIRGAPVASDRERVPPDDATRPSGTTTILDACWTPEALHELPGERTVRNHLPADHRPPARISPRQPNAPLRDEFARSVRSVRPVNGEKLVALTFDLCEQANEMTGYDGAIVDLLRAAGAHATFYAGGKWMRSHPTRTMQLMADPLFEIGNHAWTHGNLRVLRGQEMEAQIQWTQAQYELLRDQLLDSACAAAVPEHARQRIPPLPTTFRFPYGTCDATALTAVAQAGLHSIQWNLVSGDPAKGQTTDRIVTTVLHRVRPGSIVVAHANGRGWHTQAALKTLIPALKQQGYRFVTVSELLHAGDPVAVDACYEERPGDNRRYDKLFGRGTK
jgi:peptidoglycan/xylan/chitin deacetylase (PgdA/CDA1 family)